MPFTLWHAKCVDAYFFKALVGLSDERQRIKMTGEIKIEYISYISIMSLIKVQFADCDYKISLEDFEIQKRRDEKNDKKNKNGEGKGNKGR